MAPRDGVDTPKLFSDSQTRYKAYEDRVGASIGNVATLADTIFNSDIYPGDKAKDLPRLVECVEQMARMDAESKARGRVCGSIRHLLVRERNNNEDPVNEVEEYQRQIEVEQPSWTAQEAAAVEGNRHVKLLRRLVATEENGDDDNVIVQTSGETQRRCPCTCGPLERPVVNKECEHVYSTAGIIGYLYQGNGGRVPKKMEDVNPALTKPCPCAGCTSSVRAAGLERDFRTENSQRHAQRRAETQHGNAVDDDDVEEL